MAFHVSHTTSSVWLYPPNSEASLKTWRSAQAAAARGASLRGIYMGRDLQRDLVRPLIPWHAAAAGGLVLCTMRELTLTGGLCSQESTAKRLLKPNVRGMHAGLRAGLQGRSWQLVPL